jgi:hypothetical protein
MPVTGNNNRQSSANKPDSVNGRQSRGGVQQKSTGGNRLMEEEWSRLQQALTTCFSQGVTFKDGIENQFLNRLIQIITDASAGHGDIFAGYDAMRSRKWY